MRRRAALALLLAAGCGGRAPGRGAEPVWLADEAAARGLDFRWISGHREKHYFPEIMGGGAALVDLDQDGDLDAYLVQAGGIELPTEERPSDQVFRNRGGGRFEDASAAAGVDERGFGMGVAAGDVDDDGRIDLYVTNVGPNVLYRNQGAGRLADETALRGGGDPGWSTSAAFFDYDRDGDLDLYVANYIVWSVKTEIACYSKPHPQDYCSPKSYDAPAPDTLYRNDGGQLVDASLEVGLRAAFGNGLGLVCADFDGDGFEDVFVANDGVQNQLWMNQAGQRFVDRATELGCAVDQDGHEKAGMGTAAGDLDDDGDEDLLVVNLTGETDTLFRNDGARFVDRTVLSGIAAVSRPYTRFGAGFADLDHDGWLDLYQANGRVTRDPEGAPGRVFEQPNLLFRGTGPWRLAPVEPLGGTREPLVATSRAAAFGDVDGDGGVDVLVVNRDAPAYLLIDQVGGRGHWIAFRLREASGRDALGARLELHAGARRITRVLRSAYSYCAASDPYIDVGLGAEDGVRDVVVTWVGGERELFGDFAAGATVELERGRGTRLPQ
jgi:hypothetical protein